MTLSMNKKIHQVWGQYGLEEISSIKGISGGLINETYKIISKKGKVYILQKLQRIFNQDLMADIEIIAEHLEKNGWKCPSPLKTREGGNFATLGSEMWRVYEYIPGNDFSSITLEKNIYFEIGEIIGLFHRSLATLEYTPLHKIEGFHDKYFYIEKALNIEKSLYPVKLQYILDDVIEGIETYSSVLTEHHQLIHGDPRVENILFSSKGNPFTFIDYDTFMFESIYLDVGDCLRSLMSLEGSATFFYIFQEFVSGYSLGNPEAKIQNVKALFALKYVTLELTLRFLIDSVEQSYFSWNPKLYETATEHNEDRARQYWNLFKKINQKL